MPGPFDDLIEAHSEATPSGGPFDDLIAEHSTEDVGRRLKEDQDFEPTPEQAKAGYAARHTLPDLSAALPAAKDFFTKTIPDLGRKAVEQIPGTLADSVNQFGALGGPNAALTATAAEALLQGTYQLGSMLTPPLRSAADELAAEMQDPKRAFVRNALQAIPGLSWLTPAVQAAVPRSPQQEAAAVGSWVDRTKAAGEEQRAMAPALEGRESFLPGANPAAAALAGNVIDPTLLIPAAKAAGLLSAPLRAGAKAGVQATLEQVAKNAADKGGAVRAAVAAAAPVVEGAAEKAGTAAGTVGKVVDTIQPVLDVAGLVKGGLPGAAGAHVAGRAASAGLKWAKKVGEAATGLRNVAAADWNSAFPVYAQLAKDADAPVWLKRAASSAVAPAVEATLKTGGAIGEGALHGAGIGTAAGAANDTMTPEEKGGAIGVGGAFGAFGAALGRATSKGARVEAAQAHDIAVRMQKTIDAGTDPAAVLGASDSTMYYADNVEKLFKGAMPGGKDLEVRLLDPRQFAEANPDEPGAVAYYRQTPDGRYEAAINLAEGGGDARLLHEALGHALIDSVVGSNQDVVARVKAVYSPELLQQASEQYAKALKPDATPEEVAAYVQSRREASQAAHSDPDAWIAAELFAEAAVQKFAGMDLLKMATPGFLGRLSRRLRTADALPKVAEAAEKAEVKSRAGQKFDVSKGTFFKDEVAAKLSDQNLAEDLTQRVRDLGSYRPGVDATIEPAVKVKPTDWGKAPHAPLHDLPGGAKGTDFVVQKPDGTVIERTPKQVRTIVKNRVKAIDAAVPKEGVPAPAADADPMVKLRRTVSGMVERAGTKLGDWFYQGNVFSETTKAFAHTIEAAIEAGEALAGWYHQIGESSPDWKQSVAREYGNLSAQYKDFVPIGFSIPKKGNLLVRNYSLTAFERKAAQWSGRKGPASLELWNGDVGQFRDDVKVYLKNHAEGRPGADGIGEAKRNVINAFMVGANRTFETANPLRVSLRGEDKQGLVRSYRLDRLETLEPSQATGFNQPKYEKQVKNLSPKVADDRTSGVAFKNFFSDVTKGAEKYRPQTPWKSLLPLDDQETFVREYGKHTGNFDNHIATSIPGYKDVQVRKGAAIVAALPEGGRMLDVGASEGSFAKTVSALSGGKIETVALDPNPDMAKFFREKSTVPRSSYVEEAFLNGFEDGGKEVPAYAPDKPFDVIHEAMVFQFISKEREAQVAEVKRMLGPEGVFLTEEKVLTPPDVWKANELKKDKEFKNNYYSDEKLAAKQAVVKFQQDPNETRAVGMVDNMVSDRDFEALLQKTFKHVVQYWDSGNFKGYAASDSPVKLQKIVDGMGDLNTKFSTEETPRKVADSTEFSPAAPTDSPESKKWFGGSKVSNAEATPGRGASPAAQFSPAASTDSPEFKKWFKGSMFQKDGKPEVWYHGTGDGGFTQFGTTRRLGRPGEAAFFTNDERMASTYSGSRREVDLSLPDAERIVKDKAYADEHGFEIFRDPTSGNIEVYHNGELHGTLHAVESSRQKTPFSKEQVEQKAIEYVKGILPESEPVQGQGGLYHVFVSLTPDEVAELDWGGHPWGDHPEYGTTDDAVVSYSKAGARALLMRNVSDPGPYSRGEESGDVLAVMDPDGVVKSATQNTGPFDRKNPDIRFSPSTSFWLTPDGKKVSLEDRETHSDVATRAFKGHPNPLQKAFDSGWVRVAGMGDDLYANTPTGKLTPAQRRELVNTAIENKKASITLDTDEEYRQIWTDNLYSPKAETKDPYVMEETKRGRFVVKDSRTGEIVGPKNGYEESYEARSAMLLKNQAARSMASEEQAALGRKGAATPSKTPPTGWILPSGEYIGAEDATGAFQNTGDWHLGQLQKNAEDFKKRFGLTGTGEDARFDAVKKGFVRVRLDGASGRLGIEALAPLKPATKQKILDIVESNSGRISKVDLNLFNRAGKVVGGGSESLFREDAQGKRAAVEAMFSPKVPDSPEFKKWFTGSKVVDGSGQPLVVYHGTSNAEGFSKMRLLFRDAVKNKDPNSWTDSTLGHFFAGEPSVAAKFADEATVPAFLKITKPYRVSGERFYRMLDTWTLPKYEKLKARLTADGYDGIVVAKDPTIDQKHGPGWSQFDADTYIAFSGKQVRGVFSDKFSPKVSGPERSSESRKVTAFFKTNEAAKLVQDATDGSGPFDGGCLICAKALQRAFDGGDIIHLQSAPGGKPQAEHYGLKLPDGRVADGRGIYPSESDWKTHFAKEEAVHRPMTVESGVLEDSVDSPPDDPAAVRKLAAGLQKFGIGPAFSPKVTAPVPAPEFTTSVPGVARSAPIKPEEKGSPIRYANLNLPKRSTSGTKIVLEDAEARPRFFDRLTKEQEKVANDPARLGDPKGYAEYMRNAGVYGDIMTAPPGLRDLVNDPAGYVKNVEGGYHEDLTKPGTKEAAIAGLDSTVEMRKLIRGPSDGAVAGPPPLVTALHHFWGILSRQLPPVQQEAAWLRLVSRPEVLAQIQKSIDGTYDLTNEQWSALVSAGMKETAQGDNKMGNQGTSNANAFHLMLARWNGAWDKVSDVYAAPNSIEMGRRFWSLDRGPVGIKNKVQRFIGLTYGIPGLIMDRWKFVELYMGQYKTKPRDYFDYSATGTPSDPNGIYGAYGPIENGDPTLSLAFYEGLETALQKAIDSSSELKTLLGAHANVGGLHWMGWNAIKNEAVGHLSLGLTYDLLKESPEPTPEDVLKLIEAGDDYTEGLDGNTLKRFSLNKSKK